MDDCRNCNNAKDKYKDSCFCVYYGILRTRPKKDCWGWEQKEQPEAEKEEKE